MDRQGFLKRLAVVAGASLFPRTAEAQAAGARQAVGYLQAGFRFPLHPPFTDSLGRSRPGKSGVIESVQYPTLKDDRMKLVLRVEEDTERPTIPPENDLYMRMAGVSVHPSREVFERDLDVRLGYMRKQMLALYDGQRLG
jgi:hypothetical protein